MTEIDGSAPSQLEEGAGAELDSDSRGTASDAIAEESSGNALVRALVLFAVIGLSAALAFVVMRSLFRRSPSDPTSERIQSLIDEANRLLKELDDKKSG